MVATEQLNTLCKNSIIAWINDESINSIVHHITDTAALWAEIKRLARPGSLVFLRDLARPVSAQVARSIVEQHSGDESPLLREEFYRSLLSSYTVAEVREQLGRAGLDTLTVTMATDRHLDVFGRLPRH